MNIFERNKIVAKKVELEDSVKPEEDKVVTETSAEVIQLPAEAVVTDAEIIEKPENKLKQYKVRHGRKNYKVVAISQEEAEEKIAKFFTVKTVEEKIDKDVDNVVLSVKDIFNAILEEITRIVTVAHPETIHNTYDRWIAVLTEELGEIVHEINDEYEGKKPDKNTFVECIQLASATVLLAKKFANEHPEMFEED